jgi:hypothetical protein
VWKKGDIEFTRCTAKSNATAGRFGKLMFPVIGHWEIFEDSTGDLFKIQHCFDKDRVDKKHASNLSVYPLELINFEPVDGRDNRYGQLHLPIE